MWILIRVAAVRPLRGTPDPGFCAGLHLGVLIGGSLRSLGASLVLTAMYILLSPRIPAAALACIRGYS
jgi:hypothetical protein